MKILPLVAAVVASAIAPMVSAYQGGDIIARAGAAYRVPNDSSSVSGEANQLAVKKLDSDTQLGVAGTYMMNDRFGIELSSATPSKQDLKLQVNGADGKIGSIESLPVNLVLQTYLLNSNNPFQPYIGVGVNYTHYDVDNGHDFNKVDASDTWGGVAQVGADYKLTDNLLLNAAATYNQSATDIKADDWKFNHVGIDPWTFRVGLGYKFS